MALEELWSTPVTAEALQAELNRIARSTRFPERLQEIYAALGEDPVIIQECFARQSLVDRLARGFFATDERFHGKARAEAELLRQRLLAGEIDSREERAGRGVVAITLLEDGEDPGTPRFEDRRGVRLDGSADRSDEAAPIELREHEYERWRGRMPSRVGEVGPVLDERDAFVVDVLLEDEDGRATAARYAVPRTPWAMWWAEVEKNFHEDRARQVATGSASFSLRARHLTSDADTDDAAQDEASFPLEAAVGSSCPPDDSWDPEDMPSQRTGHSAIWTGSMMIVWGGTAQGTGARYDPVTDSWTIVSVSNAPGASASGSQTAVWTGSEMIVWSGNAGGRYHPLSDSWPPISTTNAPLAPQGGRVGHVAVWTDSEMIVWGGFYYGPDPVPLTTGGRYDPDTDTWTPTSVTNAPVGGEGQTAVWTGSEMIVVGGRIFDANQWAYVYRGAGRRYNPAADTWTAIPDILPRSHHSAVWTGSEMIIWGGISGSSDGARYNPVSNGWTATSTGAGTPSPRHRHTAVWTGTEMLVWGGSGPGVTSTGGRYNPGANTWVSIATTNAPSPRTDHTAVWTDGMMVVWGGAVDAFRFFSTGGRYDPITNTWTPTHHTGVPGGRALHGAVWTGNRMIVWGGLSHQTPFNLGGQYDPLTHTWTHLSTVDAPVARYSPIAVWTGNRMLVWGGESFDWLEEPENTGGLYDPLTDAWAPTSVVDAPVLNSYNRGVWTGRELIVFGSIQVAGFPFGGARYDPVADDWTPTSLPTRNWAGYWGSFTAVWTGTEVILWGGRTQFPAFTNIGWRYNPFVDAWTPIPTIGAPAGREEHVAVWTGAEMIVWGGSYYTTGDGVYPRTGGRYDPIANAWRPTSTTNAPIGRARSAAVWTDSEMVVWGGGNGNTGGRYDPLSDTWVPIVVAGSPSMPFGGHSAVWTGQHMIVWGGSNYGYDYEIDIGGMYDPGPRVDADGDGVVCEADCDDGNLVLVDADGDGAFCETDCDDGNQDVFPGALETCDGVDNDCDAAIDEDEDGDRRTVCSDCNDLDPGSFAPPGAVAGFAVLRGSSANQITLRWSSQASTAGRWTGYDIFWGFATDLRPGGDFSTGSCLADDRPAPFSSQGEFVESSAVPPGGIRYYVLRAQNACPSGTATYGTANRDTTASLSANPCEVCGDGMRRGVEECEGSDLSATCQDLGFGGGTMGCDGTCHLVLSGCNPCGNNVRDPGETCDGSDLFGYTCQSFGYDGGSLACSASCNEFEFSACTTSCGNNVLDPGETCDGTNLGGFTCQTFGYDGGSLACSASCDSFDDDDCHYVSCGDNLREGSELCDGTDLGGQSCQSLGHGTGTLVCSPGCHAFQFSGCTCGNGVRDESELCDGPDLGGETCESQGRPPGALACGATCDAFNFNACATCGNGVREGSEQCDGTDLGGETCTTQGQLPGTLACYPTCTFSYAGCEGF